MSVVMSLEYTYFVTFTFLFAQKMMMLALQTGSYVALKHFCLVVVALLLHTLLDNLLTDSYLRLRSLWIVDCHCYH